MTLADITERVANIEACKGDCEAAHGMEDDLRADFLAAIRDNAVPLSFSELREMAAAVLTTSDIKFPRYCA